MNHDERISAIEENGGNDGESKKPQMNYNFIQQQRKD